MRTYERDGVMIDQCEECRGIYLDRGELEKLLDAESGSDRPARRDDDERDGHDRDEHRHGRRRTSPSSLIADLLGGCE
jgi:Zn-finger nucleic acid-binding protein